MAEHDTELDSAARKYESGTLSNIWLTGLDESLSTLSGLGIDRTQEHVLDLTEKVIKI